MTALFSTSQHKASQNTVEFKAGQMKIEQKMVSADPRKGKITMQFNSDNLLRLTWTDRTSNKIEHDLMILPDEVEFVKIPECKTGRVFLLRWKEHPRRLFFWMQESDVTKDEALFKRVSDLVENPKPTPTNIPREIASSRFLEGLTNLHGSNQEIYDIFRSMSPHNVSHLLNHEDSTLSPTSASAGAPAASNQTHNTESMIDSYRQVLKEALRRATAEHQRGSVITTPESSSTNQTTQLQKSKTPLQPDFSRALSWKNLKSFFESHPDAFETLKDFLPDNTLKTNEELIACMQCPQFTNAKRMLEYIISTGQFKHIAKQFHISNTEIDQALDKGDLIAFCKELDRLLLSKEDIDDTNMDDLD